MSGAEARNHIGERGYYLSRLRGRSGVLSPRGRAARLDQRFALPHFIWKRPLANHRPFRRTGECARRAAVLHQRCRRRVGCVYCRSAFRWPARLVYAKLGHTDAHSFTQSVSYSPFPASLNIEPVETRWASAFAAGPAPVVRDVTIIVEEPLALVRRDFEAAGVKLNEFTFRPVTAPPQPPVIAK